MNKIFMLLLTITSLSNYAEAICGNVDSIIIKTEQNLGTKNKYYAKGYVGKKLIADLNDAEISLLVSAKANNLNVCVDNYINNTFNRKISL